MPPHLSPATCLPAARQNDFAYTMAAAYRSEQRRLLRFVRMSDLLICDTLHTILTRSLAELLDAVCPALPAAAPSPCIAVASSSGSGSGSSAASTPAGSSGRGLRAMQTMLGFSRQQRQAVAAAGMAASPVSAGHRAAGGEAGAAASAAPMFEVQVLLSDDLHSLVFAPALEEFQVRLSAAGAAARAVLATCPDCTLHLP